MRPLFALLLIAILANCEEPREWKTRVAVQRLAKGPGEQLKTLERVVKMGSYAITDIEQQMHAANDEGKVRLLNALRRIGDPVAIPLVSHLKKWAADKKVRKEAAYTLAALVKRQKS